MACTSADLIGLGVVSLCDGRYLGRVSELEIDTSCGRVTAIITDGDSFNCMVFKKNRVRIPWDRITKIGKDTILVEYKVSCSDEIRADKCDVNEVKSNRRRWWC